MTLKLNILCKAWATFLTLGPTLMERLIYPGKNQKRLFSHEETLELQPSLKRIPTTNEGQNGELKNELPPLLS